MEPPELMLLPDAVRVADLRTRVREAMERPPAEGWDCPARIEERHFSEPIPVRKARAIDLKLSAMPTDLWEGQLFAGSMTLEKPRVHAERGFPEYITKQERDDGAKLGANTGCFGHIVPDYPRLLAKGLRGIRADAQAQRPNAATPEEHAFLDSVEIVLDAVLSFADRLAQRCEGDTARSTPRRAAELLVMAENLRRVPAGPAQTFWQALQSVWLLHLVFHSTMNGNACAAPKHGNDDGGADSVGQALIDAFCAVAAKHAEQYQEIVKFPCGVGTFSWYLGIGQGLGASSDGRLAGEPVSSNFSPALGRDKDGLPSAILSYSKMHKSNLPAGGPLDLRVSKRLLEGDDGTRRLSSLIRGLVDSGGNMMTLTVADVEELRAAQREPENYRSLRVRMGGWWPTSPCSAASNRTTTSAARKRETEAWRRGDGGCRDAEHIDGRNRS